MAAFTSAMVVGNPSSVHREGQRARAAVEAARGRVAALVDAQASGVVFTAGGTEANNAALRPGALRTPDGRPVRRLLVGATEHASVLSGHGFAGEDTRVLPVDRAGRIALDVLEWELRDGDAPTLVSLQAANSETGVLQPIREAAVLARAQNAAIHVDAVQAAGRIPLDMVALGLDALTLSAHKLGGPMGSGALVVAPGRAGPGSPLLRGGGQENGRRAGTENVPAIVGFGVAAGIALRDLAEEGTRLRDLRDALVALVRDLAPDAILFGEGAEGLPNTLAFAVPGLRAETALMAFDLDGVAVSSGSACSSGKVGRSHVLAAMGICPDLAIGAIRVSLGWNSRLSDLDHFGSAFASVLQRLYRRDEARAA